MKFDDVGGHVLTRTGKQGEEVWSWEVTPEAVMALRNLQNNAKTADSAPRITDEFAPASLES